MMLGALLARLDDTDAASEALLALGDLVLSARVAEMGQAFDETPGVYIANAARRFAHNASSDDWLALMSAIGRADAPGDIALQRMALWALDKDSGAKRVCACLQR